MFCKNALVLAEIWNGGLPIPLLGLQLLDGVLGETRRCRCERGQQHNDQVQAEAHYILACALGMKDQCHRGAKPDSRMSRAAFTRCACRNWLNCSGVSKTGSNPMSMRRLCRNVG